MSKTSEEWAAIGARRLSISDIQGAAEAFTRAVRLDKKNVYVLQKLSYCQKKMGNADGAIESLNEVLTVEQNPKDAHSELGHLFAAKGDAENANRHYVAAAESGALALNLGVARWPVNFAKMWPSLTPKVAEDVSKLAGEARSALGQGEDYSCKAIDHLRSGPPLPSALWLYLYGRLLRDGQAKAAYEAKCCAAREVIRKALERVPTDLSELEDAVAAASYVRAFSEGDEIIKTYRAFHEPQGKWKELRCEADLLLMQGNVSRARALFRQSVPSAKDDEFRESLGSRDCAVVGPAKNNLNNGERIDSSDVVVRTNFMGDNNLKSNANMLGTKTNVSYYSTPFYYMHKTSIEEALNYQSIDWAIMRFHGARKQMAAIAPKQNVRTWASYKKPNFIGIGFAMRHLLFDLLLASDSQVTVYGADFYLGTDTHYEGYMDNIIETKREMARHDVFDTFMFLQALRKSDAIKVDKVLSDILENSAIVFAERISDRFSRDIRIA